MVKVGQDDQHNDCNRKASRQCGFSDELLWSTNLTFSINAGTRQCDFSQINLINSKNVIYFAPSHQFLNYNQFYVVNEHSNRGLFHCIRYIYFVRDTSSVAYFKDNLMLIKD